MVIWSPPPSGPGQPRVLQVPLVHLPVGDQVVPDLGEVPGAVAGQERLAKTTVLSCSRMGSLLASSCWVR